MLASLLAQLEDASFKPAQTRRPRGTSAWTEAKVVTFIVTLAARQSVTLAARAAGMSRMPAYAHRNPDCAFDKAWDVALAARANHDRTAAPHAVQDDELGEIGKPPVAPRNGDDRPRRTSLNRIYEQLSGWRRESDMALLAAGPTLP